MFEFIKKGLQLLSKKSVEENKVIITATQKQPLRPDQIEAFDNKAILSDDSIELKIDTDTETEMASAFKKAIDKQQVLVVGEEPREIKLADIIKDLKVTVVNKPILPRYPNPADKPKNVIYFNPNVHAASAGKGHMIVTNEMMNRCIECAHDPVEEEVNDLVKKVLDEVNNDLDIAAIDEELKEKTPCDPTTCWGECGGKGDCYIARDWQEKIHPRSAYTTVATYVKKHKKNKQKKYKKNKAKWQNIHNRRGRR